MELGYDYCLKEDCQRRCITPVKLGAIGVNKAADYYTTPEELFPPPPPAPPNPGIEEDDALPTGHRSRRNSRRQSQPASTVAKLQALEKRLDRELAESYERFQRGEITARQMEEACDRLVAAFNQRVMSENIRFRSMLRPRRNRGR
ncbi:MAG TPA: hypothetical protein VFV02_09535 [Acidimicrobiales bacterium]|nr:hypothetical protein [Acidimicrobiales bacterium]